jgi:hypothetical protein
MSSRKSASQSPEEGNIVRNLPLLALSACLASAPLRGNAEGKLVLKSLSVDLPDSDRTFPNAPGSDTASNNCLACHSAGMALNQPALSKAQWTAEVNKMRTAYRAPIDPIDPKDVDTIANYLVGIRGKK